MADLGYDFDASTVEPDDRNFDPLPAGTYEAMIVDSDVVDTKSSSGRMLKLTWMIVSGEFENRRVWQNVNILNQSEKAQAIGQIQLKAICDAVGVGGVRESSDLHNVICLIQVKIKNDQQYGPSNEVGKVQPHGSVQTAPAPRQAAPAPQQRQAPAPAAQGRAAAPPPRNAAPAPAGTRPWGNRAAG